MKRIEFIDLCLKRADQVNAETEAVYSRAAFLLPGIIAEGAAVAAIGDISQLGLIFERVDSFIYYLALGTTIVMLGLSSVPLIRAVVPDTKYQELAPLRKWIDEYWCTESDRKLWKQKQAKLEDALLSRLAAAYDNNATLNEVRRKHFRKSARYAAMALMPLGIAGVFRIVLLAQGVIQ